MDITCNFKCVPQIVYTMNVPLLQVLGLYDLARLLLWVSALRTEIIRQCYKLLVIFNFILREESYNLYSNNIESFMSSSVRCRRFLSYLIFTRVQLEIKSVKCTL